MITNHYGVTVDSDKPITGVCQNNHVGQFLYEEIFQGIDIDLESYQEDNPENLTDDEMESTLENWDSSQDTILIGAWKKDNEGKYMPDETGEYAAIAGECYTQVVFSHNTRRCALCSLCYPGQGDLDSDGDYLTYDLPADMYEEDN